MKLYDYSNIEKLYTVGDIHGEFSTFFRILKNNLKYDKNDYVEDVHPLVKAEQEENNRNHRRNFAIDDMNTWFLDDPRPKSNMKKNYAFNNSVIIVCGDCGFGFSKFNYYIDSLTKINELFNKTNTHIIFVRGNHDDPQYFNENLINFSNIKTIQDYSVIKTKNYTTLCVGGAISVDRIWRKQQEVRLNRFSKSKKHKLYWDGEECFLNDKIVEELKENNIIIDSVVTHTCPSFCFPKEKDSAIGWLKVDETLKNDLDKERNIMTKLFEMLNSNFEIKFWAYGHFHQQFEYLEEKVIFLALDDNFSIKNPTFVIEHVLLVEEQKKKNKKRKKTNNVSTDELYDTLRNVIVRGDGQHINDNDIVNEAIFGEENNVMVDEEPF